MDFEKEISENYNLKIKSFNPFRDAILAVTAEDRYIIKKSNLSSDRLIFINEAKEHLKKNGFENLDEYICTINGSPFIEIDNNNYVMTRFMDGMECNFDNKNDIMNISRLLASFHKASKGFFPKSGIIARSDLGKIPVFFSKRLDEIKKLKKVAKKGKSKFDYLFLQYVDYYCDIAEKAINSLNDSNYNELVNRAKLEGVFCHHDFTHHNVIFYNKKYYLINFDFCCYELKIYDIANFLRRKMRKCNWDINEAKIILNEYKQIENIDMDEMEVLKIILQFPQKFWRVSNKYYNSKRSWSEKSFVVRLQEVIEELEYHERFIKDFNSLF